VLPLGLDEFIDDAFESFTRFVRLGEEDHTDGVGTTLGQFEASFLAEKCIGDLHEQTSPVTRFRISAYSPTVSEALEDRQTLADNLVTLLTLNMSNETDATGVVFVCRVVKPLSGRQ
jgi:hypothetical protein